MQTFAEKCEAIESLLPLLHIHLDLLPQAVRTAPWGDADITPQAPRPGWLTRDCDGVCRRCEYERDCRGPWWVVVKEKLRRRYRLAAIDISLRKLAVDLPRAYRAVCLLYVLPMFEDLDSAPMPDQQKARMRVWARKGIEYMAREIPGEVMGLDDRPKDKRMLIRELLEQGYSYRQIEHMLRCSQKTIARVACAVKDVCP